MDPDDEPTQNRRRRRFSSEFIVHSPDGRTQASMEVFVKTSRHDPERGTGPEEESDDEFFETQSEMDSIDIRVFDNCLRSPGGGGSELDPGTVDAFLQMLESPSFAEEWV